VGQARIDEKHPVGRRKRVVIDLYTWSTPNGRKVSIALEELGVQYTVHPIDIGKNQQFDPSFLAISPNNKIPAIVDRDTGRAMMESGAILLYLADKHGKLMGADRWETLQWLMWQMGGIGPMLGQAHHFLRFNAGKAPYAEERFKAEAARLYGVLDVRLGDHQFLAGDYSIADIATWPWISRYEWQQIDLTEYPNVTRWYLAIADRPAVQRGYDVPAKTNDIPRPAANIR
jgi:GSH-dependent disulfide-bond oxidoreductase